MTSVRKDEGAVHQLYERLLGGSAMILKNRPGHEVATKAMITGQVGKPETSTWQIAGQLIKNAFFKAILPTFETGVAGAGKR